MAAIAKITNWVNGASQENIHSNWIEKFNPHNGELQSYFTDSTEANVNDAIDAAEQAFPLWSSLTSVNRGQILMNIARHMKEREDELAECVSIETGKKVSDALGEVGAAIAQAEFFASEGMRLYGRSLNSGIEGKTSFTVRQPHGVVCLIVPANTPIANIAWKVFPALICGNTAILKASEDAPGIAALFAKLSQLAGLPDGVLNVINGDGKKSGTFLVNSDRIKAVSFTGSTSVGKKIAEACSHRLARVSLELGGKNPFVVCDDADLDRAVHWAVLSAFSNAGQRCASGSRIIVFKEIYNVFKEKFIAKTSLLKLGIDPDCDFGPVINQIQHQNILTLLSNLESENGLLLTGGVKPLIDSLKKGFYIEPAIIEGLQPTAYLNQHEIFGPVATLIKVDNIVDALKVANNTSYGLTASIHTKDIDRALWFANRVRSGVANINCGTYGSEPHMPFGGTGLSGNGTREPGTEAINFYSELKNISILTSNEII